MGVLKVRKKRHRKDGLKFDLNVNQKIGLFCSAQKEEEV